MVGKLRTTNRRAVVITVALALLGCGGISLSGCALFDERPAAIIKAVMEAVADDPYVIGLSTGDIKQALKDAGDDTAIKVPLLLPDLSAEVPLVAASVLDTEPAYTSVEQASSALADLGRQTWQDWLSKQSRKDLTYAKANVTVHLDTEEGKPVASVSNTTMSSATFEVAQVNARLFVKAVEGMPQWQMPVVRENLSDFAAEVTGLSKSMLDLVKLDSIEPQGDSTYKVTLSHPDPKGLNEAKVQKALESYGTKKLFDKTRDDFVQKVEQISDVSADGVTTVTSSAVVKLTYKEGAGDDRTLDPSVSVAKLLVAQAGKYSVQAEPGSFTVPEGISQAEEAAIDKAWEQLSKQVVKKQARPATKILVGGKSGQSVKIQIGSSGDRHVTFFKWGSKTQVASAFIRKGKTLTLRLPIGSYRLVYASGDTWYGKKYSYGPTGEYTEFRESYSSTDAMKIKIQANYSYTISISMRGVSSDDSVPSGDTSNPYEE